MIPRNFLFALRLVRHRLGFYGFVILTLAIAIGANTALFSLLFGVVLSPLDYAGSRDLVRIWQTSPDWVTEKSDRVAASYPNLQDWRARNQVFEDLAAYAPIGMVLFRDDRSVEVPGARVTENFFPLLRVAPAVGRVFAEDDYEAKDPNVAVISQRLSRDLFGDAAKSIGERIRVDDRSLTIVGVLPDDFQWWFPASGGAALKWASTDLWIRISLPDACLDKLPICRSWDDSNHE